ncbi:MAG: hypothetical protein KAJ08_01970, partial [Deltaproteobacteria bacterium]|nr:hypothetical protein [Deltaproteobacteria bacterium]
MLITMRNQAAGAYRTACLVLRTNAGSSFYLDIRQKTNYQTSFAIFKKSSIESAVIVREVILPLEHIF